MARVVAVMAPMLLIVQLLLVWRYVNDRAGGETPGDRFPLPEPVVAMAQLVERAEDPLAILVALNGHDLRVDVTAEEIGALAPVEHHLVAIHRMFGADDALLQGREVAVFVAVPDHIAESDIRRGDRSIWTRFPMRIAIEMEGDRTLVVETRDDLLTQVYSVPPGWWSGIFAAIAASIALFALHVETRPLVRLARAAEQFGRDGKPQTVPMGARGMCAR